MVSSFLSVLNTDYGRIERTKLAVSQQLRMVLNTDYGRIESAIPLFVIISFPSLNTDYGRIESYELPLKHFIVHSFVKHGLW